MSDVRNCSQTLPTIPTPTLAAWIILTSLPPSPVNQSMNHSTQSLSSTVYCNARNILRRTRISSVSTHRDN